MKHGDIHVPISTICSVFAIQVATSLPDLIPYVT